MDSCLERKIPLKFRVPSYRFLHPILKNDNFNWFGGRFDQSKQLTLLVIFINKNLVEIPVVYVTRTIKTVELMNCFDENIPIY